MGEVPRRSETTECNLGPPPTLQTELESFLAEQIATQGSEQGCDLPPESSIENYEVWMEWQGCQVNTLDWWELVAIPDVDDAQKLAWKVQASFEIPRVRSQALWVNNDYSAPPAPKCINRKAFLPVPDPGVPCQDYREGLHRGSWLTPRPFSIGLRKPTHQILAKSTFWQDVSRN